MPVKYFYKSISTECSSAEGGDGGFESGDAGQSRCLFASFGLDYWRGSTADKPFVG